MSQRLQKGLERSLGKVPNVAVSKDGASRGQDGMSVYSLSGEVTIAARAITISVTLASEDGSPVLEKSVTCGPEEMQQTEKDLVSQIAVALGGQQAGAGASPALSLSTDGQSSSRYPSGHRLSPLRLHRTGQRVL